MLHLQTTISAKVLLDGDHDRGERALAFFERFSHLQIEAYVVR